MGPSSYTIFARKINGSGWTERTIRRKFKQQVDKDDYAKSEQHQILKYLFLLSKKV